MPDVAPQVDPTSDGASFLHLVLGPAQTIGATRDETVLCFSIFDENGTFVRDDSASLSDMHKVHSAFSIECWRDFIFSLVRLSATPFSAG